MDLFLLTLAPILVMLIFENQTSASSVIQLTEEMRPNISKPSCYFRLQNIQEIDTTRKPNGLWHS